MLESLRRKSLVKTYNDPIHQVHFENGLARYGNLVEIDVCNQRLSKKLQKISFKKTIDTISIDTRVWLRFNMIYCPKGTFIMGHEDIWNNKPREETIERPFLLGETEITQELYQAVMDTNPSHFQSNSQNPVEQVSWYDAILFCNELSKLQGLDECYTNQQGWLCDFDKNGYRLPTAKEWEYAAKAGTQNRWAGTNDENKVELYAIYEDNSKINENRQTHPVKTKQPNEWGFYDMSGNVYEWCWDEFELEGFDEYEDEEEDLDGRVNCGGSWYNSIESLCSDSRTGALPNNDELDFVGFRVARTFGV